MKAFRFGGYLILAWLVVAGHSLPGVPLLQAKRPAFQFEDFPVHEIYHGRPASPVFPKHFGFYTKVREAARKGPNFAGHYTIAEWGCGSGCQSFVVVDAISGTLYYSAPFEDLDLPSVSYGGVEYRLDSSLFIADGCPEHVTPKETVYEPCSISYYEFKDRQFHLLARIEKPLAPAPGAEPSDTPSKP